MRLVQGFQRRGANWRRAFASFIRGKVPLEDLSVEERRAMWPNARDLDDKHVRRCRVLPNRNVLLSYMPQHAVCAEIGIWECIFSQKIIDTTKPHKLHLIDLDERWINVARQKFPEQIASDQVVISQGDSAKIISNFPDQYFDWIYIDGDHSLEGVTRDIEACLPKIKPEGIICLNDYTFFGTADFAKYGVMEAVHKFCVEHDFEFVFLAIQGRGYHDVAIRKL